METKKNKNGQPLFFRMGLALILGLSFGIFFIFIREILINNDKENIWNLINSILFQDISVEEGKSSLGIFYLLGQLFINLLQLVIVPLIFSSIGLAMCHINDTKRLGKIAFKTLSIFLFMYIIALFLSSVIGILAHKIGIFKVDIKGISSVSSSTISNPLMIFLNAVPNNILAVFSTNSRILSIVFLSVTLGICINKLEKKAETIKKILEETNAVISLFLNFIINKLSPLAIFILVSRTFAIYGVSHLKPALAYIFIVSITSLLFLFICYPLIIYFKTKLNPFIFMKKISKAALLGLSAASSAAALSLNKKISKEEIGIDENIVSFVLPLGMTINMNGTAIMQVIATVFIASSAGYEISFQNLIVISFLALVASVGAPSIPGSSTIVLFTILTAMGYNNEATLIAYSLVIAINRPVDMLITAINVSGDSATALIVSKSENSLNEEIYNSPNIKAFE